jgi:hypothetical protein
MEQISGKVKTTSPHAAAKNAECGLFYFGGDTDISLPGLFCNLKEKVSSTEPKKCLYIRVASGHPDIPLFKLAGYSFSFKKYCEEVILYREEEHENNSFSR